MKTTILAGALAALALTASAPKTHACSPALPDGFAVDEEAHGRDVTAPTIESLTSTTSFYDGDSECFGEHWSIDLFVTGTDDETPAADIGYIVLEAGRSAPTKLDPGTSVERTFDDGSIRIRRSAELEGTIALDVYPVDLGGNVGEVFTIDVPLADAEEGCSVSTGGPGSSSWLVLSVVGLGIALRRRR